RGDGRESAENPSVFHGQFVSVDTAGGVAVKIQQREPGGVPQFVAEIARQFETLANDCGAEQGGVFRLSGPLRGEWLATVRAVDARLRAVLVRLLDQLLAVRAFELDRHADILRFGAHVREAESQRIDAELADDVERIDAVPLAL